MATTTSGAAVGGYSVDVTQLANSGQRTYTFNSPTSDETFTVVGGSAITVKAGSTTQELANSINSDSTQSIYAAALDSNTIVFSDRATGAPTSGQFTTVGGSPTSLTEQASLARAGRDASYSIDGGASQTSHSNTITGAIAGVTLNLTGITTTSGPVTVSVTPPAPSTSGIEAAVKTFVDSYNSMIDSNNAQVTQVPTSSDPTQGPLYGDNELTDLMSQMREQIYTPNSSLTGIQSLADPHHDWRRRRRFAVLARLGQREVDDRHDEARSGDRIEPERHQGDAPGLVKQLRLCRQQRCRPWRHDGAADPG